MGKDMNKPVAWMHKNPKYTISKHWSQEYNIPLYTHPVKELTDEEIAQVYEELYEMKLLDKYPLEFAKAILRKAQEK